MRKVWNERRGACWCQAAQSVSLLFASRSTGERSAGIHLKPTDTPATLLFCHRSVDGPDAGLFRSGPSSPVVSSGTAKADVVVAVARIVRVAVRAAHVLRVVVPGAATQHPVEAGFATNTLGAPYTLSQHVATGVRRSCSRRQLAAGACAVIASAEA